MEQFEKGELVWVASSEMDWGYNRHREYVVYHNGHHHCVSKTEPSVLVRWRLARKIPEESTNPTHYTQETFPKGEVWIRKKNKRERFVFSISDASISCPGALYLYSELIDFEISTDGRRTWCKAVPESE